MPRVDFTSLRSNEIRELEDEFNSIRTLLRALDLQNMDFQAKTITTPTTPGDELAVDHNLERRPDFFLANFVDNPGILYRGTTPWTATQIFLRSDVGSEDVEILIL